MAYTLGDMKTKKRLMIVSAICFAAAFILFPIFSSNGLSLKRQATVATETDGSSLITISAFVYRGVYFSPDGPNMARWYYEKIRINGEGEVGSLGSRQGRFFRAGTDFECVGTKFYNRGTLFLDDAGHYMLLSLSKDWGYGSASPAYVNGSYKIR